MPPALPRPCLCLVTDRAAIPEGTLPRRVAQAVAGGVDLVQLRAKDLPGGELLSLARQLLEAIDGRAALLVNERVDVAAAVGAAGVQLGEEALPPDAARALLPAGAWIGRSVHSVDGAVAAARQGADFLLVGTMFATPSHPGGAAAGPELLGRIAAVCPLPLIGIGGITAGNLGAVIDAGASGVAVIRSILAADDPEAAARWVKRELRAAWRRRPPAAIRPPISTGGSAPE